MRGVLARALLAVSMLLACAGSCASRNSTPSTAPEPSAVVLKPPSRPEIKVLVEVARTDPDRARGLMFRDRLEPDRGMLFLFDTDAQHSFWMKNTYIPLDMIFITRDMKVLGIVENAEPLTTTPRQVPGVSRYVLEVVGGFAQRHGIAPGTPVELRNVL